MKTARAWKIERVCQIDQNKSDYSNILPSKGNIWKNVNHLTITDSWTKSTNTKSTLISLQIENDLSDIWLALLLFLSKSGWMYYFCSFKQFALVNTCNYCKKKKHLYNYVHNLCILLYIDHEREFNYAKQ